MQLIQIINNVEKLIITQDINGCVITNLSANYIILKLFIPINSHSDNNHHYIKCDDQNDDEHKQQTLKIKLRMNNIKSIDDMNDE